MLYGDALAKTLRQMAESAQERLWIITPFIGSWNFVKRILGDNWIMNGAVQVKLLTDIRNDGWINIETFSEFRKRGEVSTLAGLHAKIYVADEKILITSANLTQTAFQKRYEAGVFRKCTAEDNEYLKLLWDKSENIPITWIPQKSKYNEGNDEQGSESLKAKWQLPSIPKGTGDKNYDNRLSKFIEFKKLYSKNVKQVWPSSPVYFEIDSFFNYLFHEHPETPSHIYEHGGSADLSDSEKIELLKMYHIAFENWLKTDSADGERHRKEHHQFMRKIFSPDAIQNATWQDIEKVMSHVWSLKANPLNEYKFFNRGQTINNSIEAVIDAFGYLFDDSKGSITVRFRYFKNKLVGIGPNSVGELIGYYYPDRFPIANNNSLSGLRFFGYDVK